MFAATRSSASSSRTSLFDVEVSGALDSASAVWNMVDEVCESIQPKPKSENSWGEAVDLFAC